MIFSIIFALQNHLIVKVPPYHDQQITSAVSVGIYVVTNAGRSHDVQPFTYTPEPGVWGALGEEWPFHLLKASDSTAFSPCNRNVE